MWSIEAKQIIREFVSNDKIWRGARALSHEHGEKYKYFTSQEPQQHLHLNGMKRMRLDKISLPERVLSPGNFSRRGTRETLQHRRSTLRYKPHKASIYIPRSFHGFHAL